MDDVEVDLNADTPQQGRGGTSDERDSPSGEQGALAASGAIDGGVAYDEERPNSAPATAAPPGGRKRKRKKGKRRQKRWKPYYKLSAEELLEKDKREKEKAENYREQRFKHGQPMAPYNTTQYLVDDWEARNEQQQNRPAGGRQRSASGGSFGSESTTGSSSSLVETAGSKRLEQEASSFDFEAEYELATAERLESMDKGQLIKDFVQLENELNDERAETNRLRLVVKKLEAEKERFARLAAATPSLTCVKSAAELGN